MVEGLWQGTYKVRPYEADRRAALRIGSFFDYLQDAATEAADALGVSYHQIKSGGLAWVLVRQHLEIRQYPFFGDIVTVASWAKAWRRLYGIRDFRFADAEGNEIAVATSAWAVVRAADGRPQRPTEAMKEVPLVDDVALDDDFAPLPEVAHTATQVRFPARPSHVDVNQHVNNRVYVEWALDAVPLAVSADWVPTSVEVAFQAASHAGDTIEVAVTPAAYEASGAQSFGHQLTRTADGREVARLRSRWEPRASLGGTDG